MKTVPSGAAKSEISQLIVLLLADLLFFLVIIPISIVDPEGFGLDQGLPPSFSAQVVAVLAAALMLLRIGQLLRGAQAADSMSPDFATADSEAAGGLPVRGLTGMAVALLFAIVLVPLLGFYAAAAALMLILLLVMGERHWPRLVVFPAIVTALVWGLFDRLLSIRLPSGTLFGN